MSVSYSPLSQGQDSDRRNQPNNVHSSSAAPMAKAEASDMESSQDEHKNDENIPHVVITEPLPLEEKSNNKEEGHLNEVDDFNKRSRDENHTYLGDLRSNTLHSSIGRIPHLGLSYDPELLSVAGETIPDVNVYQHKKTLAQGMMDLALFSANANQLRYVLDSYSRHPYYWPSVICIVLSLGLQVGIGVGLIWNALYNVRDEREICIANKINNWCVVGIFLVVVVNVFVSSFGVADPPPVMPTPIG